MQKRTLKVAILAVLAIILVLGISSVALADQTWPDLPDTVTAKYKITDNQVAGISDGFVGGLWKPYQSVTRAQFTKMAVATFNIPLANPATASYPDVPQGSLYYTYVEGAKAAGILRSSATFNPSVNITRQDAVDMVARYIAKAQGFDLAAMYSADELANLLKHFGDADKISAEVKTTVAFAFDMGLTNGDDYGNFNPLANLTRIQGAAFLIRAQGLVPPNLYIPAKIEIVGKDRTEGLIGQEQKVTFQVTDAAGHPAIGVLVDFDTLEGPDFYVGNVAPQAAVTDNYGQVTVAMLSLEPGVQRLSAQVGGLGTIYATRYWLALDEVYNTLGEKAQNNTGVEHTWGARVVVFGPGERSTSVSDWYNAISKNAFDKTDVNVEDGVDLGDDWDYAYELALAKGTAKLPKYVPAGKYEPRTLAGIDVEWSIYNIKDNPLTSAINEAYTSVGDIIAVDGATITPAKTAVGKTDDKGLSTIKVYSTVTGKTYSQAVANYAGNPYPKELFNHSTFQDNTWGHNFDWDDQPTDEAYQVKTWIAHTIGGAAVPIDKAYDEANIGEERTLTLTLTDVYGNKVAGKEVEWFMQGVGFFNTDDKNDVSDQYSSGSKDYDTTNSAGQATVFAKSYEPGEQIIHVKYRDKGTGGSEGTIITYTAEIQWFDVDVVTFDDITTTAAYVVTKPSTKPNVPDEMSWVPVNEAYAVNDVNTSHTFTLWAYGLKLEYDPTLSDPTHQTPYIDSDAAGSSYDGILDYKDADYFGGVLLVNLRDEKYNLKTATSDEAYAADVAADSSKSHHHIKLDVGGKIVAEWGCPIYVYSQGKQMELSLLGGYTKFDVDRDGLLEDFAGQTGIYLPLEGKTVTFSKVDSLQNIMAEPFDIPSALTVASVGSITAPTAAVKTDAAGKATVTVTSQAKGPETIKGCVTWAGNPHLPVCAFAKKVWKAGTTAAASDLNYIIKINGKQVADNTGEIAQTVVPYYVPESAPWAIAGDPQIGPGDDDYLNMVHVEVHVQDAYGNDLPDYEVVYLLNSIGTWVDKTSSGYSTYLPLAFLLDYNTTNKVNGVIYDTNGPAPDSNEPNPAFDPYANIVGKGYTGGSGHHTDGHLAFFFNQWLGTSPEMYDATTFEGQPGIPQWPNRAHNSDFDAYYMTYLNWLAVQTVEGQPFSSWDVGNFSWDPSANLLLATDGAKAWTLDGWFNPSLVSVAGANLLPSSIQPNLLTGSNLDISLAEDIKTSPTQTSESILRVMIYAPGDGIVQEGQYLYSTQVHVIWQMPVVRTITLTPDKSVDTTLPISSNHQVTALVLDQFGNPLEGQPVYFWGIPTEGPVGSQEGTPPPAGIQGAPYALNSGNPVYSDGAGVASLTLTSAVWANWNIWAQSVPALITNTNPGVQSNTVNKYWAFPLTAGATNLDPTATHLFIQPGINPLLGGKTFTVYVDNGITGEVIASGYVYNNTTGTLVDLKREVNQMEDSILYINFATDGLTNDAPNWLYFFIIP